MPLMYSGSSLPEVGVLVYDVLQSNVKHVNARFPLHEHYSCRSTSASMLSARRLALLITSKWSKSTTSTALLRENDPAGAAHAPCRVC